MSRNDTGWSEDVHPTKGPRGDTAFLKENYKYMTIGSIFRTPSARFSQAQIHAGAKKAGFIVEITTEGPWAKVKAIGKIGPKPPTRNWPKITIEASQPKPAPTKPELDIFS